MKKLLNTLYLTTPDLYLSKDGEDFVIKKDNKLIKRYPHHIFSAITAFTWMGASPAAIKLCVENNILLSFHMPQGQFCGRIIGKTNGNVLLRREQYRIADNPKKSLTFAKHHILAKVNNSYKYLIRFQKDHKNVIDNTHFDIAKHDLKTILKNIQKTKDNEQLRGLEGLAATIYFSCLNNCILANKDDFYFYERNKRPPHDYVNALLSFGYSLLANECQSALESVGLDSYVGFLHTDRPGRASLALDLMEEFRSYLVDRFVLSLINNRQLNKKHFFTQENGSILLTDDAKRIFLDQWQKRKHDEVLHPFTHEYVPIMLLPYVQAQLLTKTIRGELESYPPFLL